MSPTTACSREPARAPPAARPCARSRSTPIGWTRWRRRSPITTCGPTWSTKPVTWLIRVADQAARVYANAEAILHLDLARRRLSGSPKGPERDRRMIEIALRQAHSLYFLGRFRESVDVLLPRRRGSRASPIRALGAAGPSGSRTCTAGSGDQRRAAASARRAIEVAEQVGDEITRAKAHGLLALEGALVREGRRGHRARSRGHRRPAPPPRPGDGISEWRTSTSR